MSFLEGGFNLTLGLSARDGVSPIVFTFALGHTEFDLRHPPFEIEFEWDEGEPLFFHSPPQPIYFPSMEQETALAKRVVIESIALRVLAYVQVVQEGLTVVDPCVAVSHVGLALPKGFDLGSTQFDTGLNRIQDLIVVPGFAILGNDFYADRVRHQA